MAFVATVYRFYDADGALLYIGYTAHRAQRWHGHTKHTPWWPLVASARLQHFATEEDARRAERAAIEAELPRFNVAHTPRARKPGPKPRARVG